MDLDASKPPLKPSLIIRGHVIATMNAKREVLIDSAIVVTNEIISHIGQFDEIHRLFPDIATIGDSSSVITPGYINAHQHLTADRLIRSAIPDTISSNEAIFDWIVPIHAQITTNDDFLSATASLVEAVTNGVTFTLEAGTVANPHEVVRAFNNVGARGTVSRWGWDIGDGPQTGTTSEVLAKQLALLTEVNDHTAQPLVRAWVSLVGHDLMSDELVVKASQLARDHNTHITFHISPHSGDVESYLRRTGNRPLVHLAKLGVLGDHVLLAHAVHIDDAEVDEILRTRTAVVSCPWAYLRLAQGITGFGRHAQLAKNGARIALGCDSENAGDAIDMLRTASLFVGLTRDSALDPQIASAYDALELITIRGAQAIGMDHLIGSLEVGKRADVVVHQTNGPQWTPLSPDPILQLIWASDGRSVSDVVINGRQVVRGGVCTSVDQTALRAEVAARGRQLLANLGKG